MADKILPTRETAIAVRLESLPTPAGKTELRALRSTHGKQFLHPEKAANGDNVITFASRLGAVCYRDDSGDLRSIDTTVRDLDGVIGVDWAPYRFRLHPTGVGFDFHSREGGEVAIKLTGIGGEKFDTEATLKPDITDNVITFKGVRPGCDIVFRCLNERVKTLRILHDATAPRTFEWQCEADKPELIDANLIGWDSAWNQLDLTSEIDGAVIRETWTGMVKTVRDPETRIKSLSASVGYPVVIDPTVNYEVGATADDGCEMQEFGGFYTGICYFGHNSTLTYHPGWRFTGVAIENAATITSATLTINATAIVGAGGAGSLKGWLTANPGAFTTVNKPTVVPKTTASTAVAAIGSTGLKNIDATAIVQELVNQVGWASGNSMALPIISTSTGNNKTFIEDFVAAGTDEASLSITYTVPSTGGPKRNTLLGVG